MFQMFCRKPSAPTDLEQEEQRARIQKLRTETELATLQLSQRHQRYERVKAIAGVGGLVTAVAAVLGLFFSTCQWLQSEESTRRLRREERLDRSLALLGAENAATRLAAVVSLSSFLKYDQEHVSQVLQALTNALAIEKSITVRNAIVATIQRLDPSEVPKVELEQGLESLVLVSRGLVSEGGLWSSRRTSVYATPGHDTVESRALSVAIAIASLLHKGARSPDMSGVYLSAVDLSGLNLQGIKWDDSILAWTDFSRGNLQSASFKDCDLESTRFVNSRLTKADFSISPDPLTAKRRFSYVREQLHRGQRLAHETRTSTPFTIHGPDFSCADARGANFRGHPLLPIYLNELSGVANAYSSFRDANLSGASFSPLGGFGIVGVGQQYNAQPFPSTSSGASWGSADQYAVTEFVLDKDAPLKAGRENYSAAMASLANTFTGSNWRTAKFDRSVWEVLDSLHVQHAARLPRCHEVN
ncbi:MAG TPA: pentapeptide repeat-containing protein [Thermoanaerobaculia bacterium]|nr:pentapeptide repeat-containing protein [Thermoanaerobaculia bacterium]